MMAEAYGKLTGRPGVCLVTRGPGTTQRLIGAARRLPGLDAAGDADRPGRRARCWIARRSRRSTTAASCRSSASGSTQVDRAERLPELLQQAFWTARSGRPGPRCARAARGHAHGRRDASPTRRPRRRRRAIPGPSSSRSCARCSRTPRRPLALVGGGTWTPRGRGRLPRLRRGEQRAGHGLVPLPGHRRQPARRSTSATRASASTRALAQRYREADLLLVDRRAARREHDLRLHARRHRPCRSCRSCTPIPARRSSAASTTRRCRSWRACPSSRRRCARSSRSTASRFAEWTRRSARADYLANREPPPGAGDGVDLSEVVRQPRRRAARRRDHHQRRGQLHGLGPPLLHLPRLPHPARADERLDGLRPAGRDRGEARGTPSARSSACAGDG